MACHKPAVLFSHAAIVDFIQSFWTFLLARVNTRLQQEDQATAQIVQRSAPASALAALTSGNLTLTETITDGGYFRLYDDTNPPKCWIRLNLASVRHADQTIVEGLKNSCN